MQGKQLYQPDSDVVVIGEVFHTVGSDSKEESYMGSAWKRAASIIAAAAISLSLAACGGG